MLFQLPTFASESGAVLTSITVHHKMNSSRLVSGLSTPKKHLDQRVLSPRLLHGETTQGFMTTNFRTTFEYFSHDHMSASQIHQLL